jgi:hypothetical protein
LSGKIRRTGEIYDGSPWRSDNEKVKEKDRGREKNTES